MQFVVSAITAAKSSDSLLTKYCALNLYTFIIVSSATLSQFNKKKKSTSNSLLEFCTDGEKLWERRALFSLLYVYFSLFARKKCESQLNKYFLLPVSEVNS